MIRQLVLLKLGLVSLSLLFWWGGEIGSAKESEAEVVQYTPVWQVGVSPTLPGVSYVVLDVESGSVLLESEGERVRPLASVTKLLAACELRRLTNLNDTSIRLTTGDIDAPGRSGRLSAGEVYTAYELLFPLLLESSNDAAAALDRNYPAQLEVINKSLGKHSVALADYSGLSDLNQGSPQGVAAAASDCLQTDRHLFDITRLKARVGEYVTWSNNSPVLDEAYRGGKHGYTEAAGRTIVAVVEEVVQPHGVTRELIYVILGSENLALDLERLRYAVATTARFE